MAENLEISACTCNSDDTGYIPEWRILYIRISNCGHARFTHSANNIESLGRRCVCVCMCVCVGGGGGGGGGGVGQVGLHNPNLSIRRPT